MRREDGVDDCAGVSQSNEFLGGTGWAWVAQLVERVLGKDEVTGSIPVPGSTNFEGEASEGDRQ